MRARLVPISMLLAGLALPSLKATTLVQLSLEEMVQRSTSVVRAKVVGAQGVVRGADINTQYRIEVVEPWKGMPVQQLDVVVPGGVFRGARQTVAGAPSLTPGDEYILFLWTSRSGLTQVIGLSQGLFKVVTDASGTLLAIRAASAESMVDRSGHPVADQGLSIRVSDLRSQVQRGATK